jgi:hypothetical protein
VSITVPFSKPGDTVVEALEFDPEPLQPAAVKAAARAATAGSMLVRIRRIQPIMTIGFS